MIFNKKYEIHQPDLNKTDDVNNKTVTTCKDNYFHSFECSYDCDFEITSIKNVKKVNKKMRGDYGDKIYTRISETVIARQKSFKVNQINKLTRKCWDDLSKTNIRYFMQLQKPFVHRWFFKKIANNERYRNDFCHSPANFFHFFCRR